MKVGSRDVMWTNYFCFKEKDVSVSAGQRWNRISCSLLFHFSYNDYAAFAVGSFKQRPGKVNAAKA